MVRRTVHIPDELDEAVQKHGGLEDSYSKIVQEALNDWVERKEHPETHQQ